MELRIYAGQAKHLSADCVFEFRTIKFPSPGEYVASLLNFNWTTFSNLYCRFHFEFDQQKLSQIATEFYQQFNLLDNNLRRLLYSLFFEDTTGESSTLPHLEQFLPVDCIYRNQECCHIPISWDIYKDLAEFSKNVQFLSQIADSDYDYSHLCDSFKYAFNFNMTVYPSLECRECLDLLGKWLRQSSPQDYQMHTDYDLTVSELLVIKEKQTYISTIAKIKGIFQSANLWDIGDFISNFLEYASLPKYTNTQDLAQLFVDEFYRLIENYKDLPFRIFVANSLFGEHSRTNTVEEIYLCRNPFEFLCCSLLCSYKYHKPVRRCERCQKFFVRHSNRQKICPSDACRSPAVKINKIRSVELFGNDMYRSLSYICKRLSHCGSGPNYKRDPKNVYTSYNITPQSSAKLVAEFSNMIDNYVQELDYHVETVYRLSQMGAPNLNDYAKMVCEWIAKIEKSCQKKSIGQLIQQALENDPYSDKQRTFRFHLYHLKYEFGELRIDSEPKNFPITPI